MAGSKGRPSRGLSAQQLKALRQAVSPQQLRQLAQQLPAEGGRLFLRMADAMEGPDPTRDLARLAASMSGQLGSGGDPQAIAQAALAQFLPQLQELQGTLSVAAGDAAGLARAQQDVAQAAEQQQQVQDLEDPEFWRDALRQLADPALLAPVRSLLENADSAAHAIQEVARGAQQSPADAQDDLARAEARLREAERGLAQLDGNDPAERLLPVVSALRERAEAAQHPRAADMLVVETAIRQALAARTAGGGRVPLERGWQQALDLAMDSGSLTALQDAARVLQAAATDTGDVARVAQLAGIVSQAADAQGDYPARVLSRLEEGLALAHSGQAARGAAVADEAGQIARLSEERALEQRARLTQAQILELSPSGAGATKIYRELLDELDPNSAREQGLAGRAALGLGRCASGKERHRALLLARDIGRRSGDRFLFIPACLALVDLHVALNQRPQAIAALVQGRALTARMGGAQAAHPFDQVAAGLREEWGATAFDRALQDFRSGQWYAKES